MLVHRFMTSAVIALLLGTCSISTVFCEPPADSSNWTQWRGPDRAGISSEKSLLKEWPEGGPKTIWQIETVGVGYSSITIKDGRIYTQGDLNGIEHVMCINASDGKLLWAVQPEPVAKQLDEKVAAEMKSYDKNQNGVVEEHEALARIGWSFNKFDRPTGESAQAIADQRVANLMKVLDSNDDGKLGYSEATGFGSDFFTIDRAERNVDAESLAKQRTALALELDSDGDQRISKKEARGTEIDQAFKRADRKDQVDKKNPNKKVGDNLLTETELEKYFLRQQGGKDGVISSKELNQYYVDKLAGRDGSLSKEELRSHLGGYRNGQGDGPRGTPTIDDDVIYTEGGNGDVTCLEASSGKTIWHVNLVSDLGGGRPGWGYSESPLVEGSLLIVTPGGSQGTLAALDKKTGDVIWRSTGTTQGAQYSSPIATNIGGIRQIVQFARSSCFGVRADTGKLMWEYSAANNGTANCSTPIVAEDHVFATSAYGTGGGLAKITSNGETQKAEQVFFHKSMADHHGGTVKVGDYLYSIGGGTLICMNFKTGEVAWKDRSVGKGSLVVADGMLYLLSERYEAALAEANPEGYREHGRFKIEGHGRPSWAHPVVAGGRLYLRNQHSLTAYDIQN